MVDDNGVAKVAGHVGKAHFVIGGDKEDAIARDGGGTSGVGLPSCILSRIYKAFVGVNVFFHSRHFLNFDKP